MSSRKSAVGLTIVLTLLLLLIIGSHVEASQQSQEHTAHSIPFSDDEFAAGTGNLDIQAFLQGHRSPLGNYKENNQGHEVSFSRALGFYAEFYGINPRVLLALLELKAGLVRNPEAPVHNLYLLDNHDPAYASLIGQLRWASEELAAGFQDFYHGTHELQVQLANGSLIEADASLTSAGFTLQRFLALNANRTQWELWTSDRLGSFWQIYTELFGEPQPPAETAPGALSLATATGLNLPWGEGETWYYTGGPHSSFTNQRYYSKCAIDFAPGGNTGCFSSSSWVRAAAAGIVRYADCNFVRVEHSGGWSTTYFHLSDIQVRLNQQIAAGTALGHPSCGVGASCGWSGSATGSHVHMDTRLNNVPQRINGTALDGWIVRDGSSDYQGTMTLEGTTKTASSSKTSNNAIRAYSGGYDTDDRRTLSSGQTVYGSRNPGADEDIYYINATAGQILTVEQWKTGTSSLDTYVYVRNQDNQKIGQDDDGGDGLNSRLQIRLSENGRFTVVAKGYGSSTGAYGLRATLDNASSRDTEDGLWLSNDRGRNGVLNSSLDTDTYYFNGLSGRIISLRMWKDGSAVDSYLELYDPTGRRVASNDDGGGNQDSWLVHTPLYTGVYRVKARSYNHLTSGGYEIRLRLVDANNMAYRRPLRATSSENGSHPPSHAVDGNPGTRWSSEYKDRQSLYVDLGATRSVDMVILRWERAYASRYGIYVWTDSGGYWDWRNVFWTDRGNGGTDVIRFSPRSTRYVMVYALDRGTPWGVSLWEFGVYNSVYATPPTTEPEDDMKPEDSVLVEVPPPATSPGKDEQILALTIGEDGYQEFLPEEGTWAGDVPEETGADGAGSPLAFIEAIHFDDVAVGPADQVYEFFGRGVDSDDDGEGIVAFEWRSSRVGLLSTSETFSTTAAALTAGEHIITFRVQDNEGNWSTEATAELAVWIANEEPISSNVYLPFVRH